MSKHWSVMNDLESSFNNIITYQLMFEELEVAIKHNDMEHIKVLNSAMQSYYKIYTSQWDRKFKIAWDNVVKGNSDDDKTMARSL